MDHWTGVEPVRQLIGGNRNTVLLARRGSQRLVVRRSNRTAEALDWELDLSAHLASHDVPVPAVVPADDGRRHIDGTVVQEFVDGTPPRDVDDWRRIVALLRRVHQLTAGSPQRPGFASARELLDVPDGGDVRLGAMPADGVAGCEPRGGRCSSARSAPSTGPR